MKEVVEEIIRKAEGLLEISIENVEEHETNTPRLIAQLGMLSASLWKASTVHKKNHTKAEARAYEKWASVKVGEKTLTAKAIDAKIDLDPEVQVAWNRYIIIEEMRRRVEALLDAMQRKSSYIPGLQGRLNHLRQTIPS